MSNIRISYKQILRNSLGAGILVFFSKVLGFLRDILLASFFGTAQNIEAFFVSERIPNLWRNIIGEGGVRTAIIPTLSEFSEDRERLWRISSSLLIVMATITITICILGSAFSGIIVRLIAPGFMRNAEVLEVCINITRVVFFYLFFITIYTTFTGILFTLREFLAPYLSPILGNIIFISGIIISQRYFSSPIAGIVFFYMLSGFSHFLPQLPYLFRCGFKFYFPRSLRDIFLPEILSILKLLFRRFFVFTVYYLNILVDTIFASFYWIVGQGGIAALYYSSRVILLPVTLIASSLGMVSMPFMSHYVSRNDKSSLKDTLLFTMENTTFFILPISFLLFTLNLPIVRLLFQRGEFGDYSADLTSFALGFYSLGLFFFTSCNILNNFFFSYKDLQSPLKLSSLTLGVNLLLNILLIFPLGIGGIALATSISSALRFFTSIKIIKKRGVSFRPYFRYVYRVFILSSIMGLFCYALFNMLPFSYSLNLLITILSSGIFYLGLSFIFKTLPFKGSSLNK